MLHRFPKRFLFSLRITPLAWFAMHRVTIKKTPLGQLVQCLFITSSQKRPSGRFANFNNSQRV